MSGPGRRGAAPVTPVTDEHLDTGVTPRDQVPIEGAPAGNVTPVDVPSVVSPAPATQQQPEIQPVTRPSEIEVAPITPQGIEVDFTTPIVMPVTPGSRAAVQDMLDPVVIADEPAVSAAGAVDPVDSVSERVVHPTAEQTVEPDEVDQQRLEETVQEVVRQDSPAEKAAKQQEAVQLTISEPRPELPDEEIDLDDPTQVANDLIDRASALPLPGPVAIATAHRLPKETLRIVAATRKRRTTAELDQISDTVAVQQVATGDSHLPFYAVSVSSEIMLASLRQPDSYLRDLLEQDETIDQSLLYSDSEYAIESIISFFDRFDVYGVVEKAPSVGESSVHLRLVKVHRGNHTKMNAATAPIMNLDFDGDTVKLTFDNFLIRNAKSYIDHLIGQDGQPMLDKDLFSSPPWYTDEEKKVNVYSYLKDNLLDNQIIDPEGKLHPSSIRNIARALEKFHEDNSSENFASLLRSVVKASGPFYDPTADGPFRKFEQEKIVSHILSLILDTAVEIRKTYLSHILNIDYSGLPTYEGENTGVVNKSLLNRLLSTAKLPANLQDLNAILGDPFGVVQGKNVLFRLHANLIRAVRGEHGLFRGLAKAFSASEKLASQMNMLVDDADNSLALKRKAYKEVERRAGRPDLQNWSTWWTTFIRAHNQVAYVANSGSVGITLDQKLVPDGQILSMIPTGKDDSTNRRKEFRKHFVATYGHYTMEYVFGSFAPLGWEKRTVQEFAYENTFTKAQITYSNESFDTVEKFIGGLADMRTSHAIDVKNNLEKALGLMMSDGGRMTLLAQTIRRLKEDETLNLDREIQILTDAMHCLTPDVFLHFGINNPLEFVTHPIGYKMATSTTANQLGGYIYEAIARYRFHPMEKARRQYHEATDPTVKDIYKARFYDALAAVESSSEAWGALCRAYRDGTDIFGEILYADIGRHEKRKRIFELMKKDPLVPRGRTIDEVDAGIYANPTGLYASDRFVNDLGRSELRTNMSKIPTYLRAYNKGTREALQEKVENWVEHVNIEEYLSAIKEDPSLLVSVTPRDLAHVITGLHEKTVLSAEKSKQEHVGNYYYTLMNLLHNCGFWADIEISSDVSFGKISLEKFYRSPGIIARLLSDPYFSVIVYNHQGERLLSQAEILPDTGPIAIKKWLIENPRAAHALRVHKVRSAMGAKGAFGLEALTFADSAKYIKTSKSDVDRKILAALADKPGFSALVSLTMPSKGKKRRQKVDLAEQKVIEVIRFLQTFPADDGPAYLQEIFRASGLDVDKITKAYDIGQAQELSGEPPGYLDGDVRDTPIYYLGQVLDRLTKDVVKYADIVAKIAPAETNQDPKKYAGWFKLQDTSTIRLHVDIIQTLSGLKTKLATSINGNMTWVFNNLTHLTRLEVDVCDSPSGNPVSVENFEKIWVQYIGHKATVGDRHIPIDKLRYDYIIDRANRLGEDIYIEDPAHCRSPLSACWRHSCIGLSSSQRGPQTSALGRYMNIIRTKSSEEFSLKLKKMGDDGRDSIIKNEVLKFLLPDFQKAMEQVYKDGVRIAEFLDDPNPKQNGIAEVRRYIAERLGYVLTVLEYKGVFTRADLLNIAQLMAKFIEHEDGSVEVKVITLGQMNEIITHAMRQAVSEDPDISQANAIKAVVAYYNTPSFYSEKLDWETIFGAVHVEGGTISEAATGLLSTVQSNVPRNIELIEQIYNEVQVEPKSEKELNEIEDAFLRNPLYRQHFDAFKNFLNDPVDPDIRGNYRVIDVYTKNDLEVRPIFAIGPANGIIVDGNSPAAAQAIAEAYRHGINVFLYRDLSKKDWKRVSKLTDGAIDNLQSNILPDEFQFSRFLIPMFDIRLNGGNTEATGGIVDMGAWHTEDENVYFIYENPINEFKMGDGEFAVTQNFTDKVSVFKPGQYTLSVRAAFANLIHELRQRGEIENPPVRIAIREDLVNGLLAPYVASLDPDGPIELKDKKLSFDLGKFDTGTSAYPGSAAEARLKEGLATFLQQAEKIGPDGLIRSCRPGEIIGFMVARDGEREIFHPIIPFEPGNHSGAPSQLDVDEVYFETETQRLVVNWRYEQPLEGQTFKIFEYDAASNKMIGNPRLIPQVTLMNGRPVDGYVSASTTAGRRLLLLRPQLMSTLMFVARMAPYGYNIAEHKDSFPGNTELKERLLFGKVTPKQWKDIHAKGPVAFFSEEDSDLNDMLNEWLKRCLDCGINPSNAFASRFNNIPSKVWFSFKLLFDSTDEFQESYMKFMNKMNKTICPPGLEDVDGTLFNSKLQVLVPVLGPAGPTGRHHWVNLSAGFHFLDEHVGGLTATGATVASLSPGLVALMGATGARLARNVFGAMLKWRGVFSMNPIPGAIIRDEDQPEGNVEINLAEGEDE